MANWTTVDEADLAATLSQKEIDAFRRDGPIDGSDAVARLLAATVATVRGYLRGNGSIRIGPAGTIPRALVIPAMEYARAKLLVRIGIPLNEDRRKALDEAVSLFEQIARGEIVAESYAEDGAADDAARPASAPAAAAASPTRLLD